MKKTFYALMILMLLLGFTSFVPASAAPAQGTIPTFSILKVVSGASVTIETSHFPANDSFDVLMGKMGTRGVNGIKVTTLSSGKGGSFTATFDIPAALKENERIAIRLQSNTGSGYFAYNWFWNKADGTGSGDGSSGASGIPVFSISSVVKDASVTIQTKSFPADETFVVRMGKIGTRGVKGIEVTEFDSAGGSFSKTFQIPEELKGDAQIAIRMDSTGGSGYYAYNWFWNNSIGTGTGGGTTPSSGYRGYPTFSIQSVVRDTKVTIQARNLPAEDTFTVTMGKMGTHGVKGTVVTTIDSGGGGSQSFTFTIPAELSGLSQISIRLESPTSGYYAYNWFWNNTAD